MINNHRILLILMSSLDQNQSYTTNFIQNLVSEDDVLEDYHKGARSEGYTKRWRKATYSSGLDEFDRTLRGLKALMNKGYLVNSSSNRVYRWKLTNKGLEKAREILESENSALALTDDRRYIRDAALKLFCS